jgi:drug/metabolite transporter (DMT)-like permease
LDIEGVLDGGVGTVGNGLGPDQRYMTGGQLVRKLRLGAAIAFHPNIPALFGSLLFGDVPDIWIIAGAVPVICSGLYILHRERIRR